MTIAEPIYVLCGLTSLAAAGLLFRQFGASPTVLLRWSCIGFVGLAINNVLVYVDLVLVPATDLSLVRSVVAAAGLVAMLYGLIWGERG